MTAAIILFAGNVIFLVLSMNHGGILVLSLIGVIGLLAFALLAAVLAKYISRGATLQEENAGTI